MSTLAFVDLLPSSTCFTISIMAFVAMMLAGGVVGALVLRALDVLQEATASCYEKETTATLERMEALQTVESLYLNVSSSLSWEEEEEEGNRLGWVLRVPPEFMWLPVEG